MPEEYKIEGFCDGEVYESLYYFLKDYKKVRNIISKDNIKIDKLVGNNGEISVHEYKILKNLDKI